MTVRYVKHVSQIDRVPDFSREGQKASKRGRFAIPFGILRDYPYTEIAPEMGLFYTYRF